MNNHTIRKLKNKFILISTLSFTIVMFFIAGCMYAANAWIMHSESRRVLDFIMLFFGFAFFYFFALLFFRLLFFWFFSRLIIFGFFQDSI